MWLVCLGTFCCGFCLGLKFLFQNPWIFVYFTGSFLLNSEVAPDGTSLSLPYAVLRGEASLTINVPVPIPVVISSFLGPKAPASRVAISGPKKSLDEWVFNACIMYRRRTVPSYVLASPVPPPIQPILLNNLEINSDIKRAWDTPPVHKKLHRTVFCVFFLTFIIHTTTFNVPVVKSIYFARSCHVKFQPVFRIVYCAFFIIIMMITCPPDPGMEIKSLDQDQH
jgi:hypothetical protein